MAPPTTDASNAPLPDESQPASRRLAVFACLLAVAVFLGCIAILFTGWLGEDATGLIIVDGHESLADTVVTISRTMEGTDRPYLRGTFAEGDHYRLRFHVPPGTYQLTLSQNGQVLFQQDVVAESATGINGVQIVDASQLQPVRHPGK